MSCATGISLKALMVRLATAGCLTLVLALELQILGQRHKDLRNGLCAPHRVDAL